MIKYLHEELLHNLDSPNEIVPEIIKLLEPKSVVDVGCGTATFLHCFKNNGVTEVLGIDGKWANKELLFKHIKSNEFIEADLEKSITIDRKFDLVVSLEVAEHVSEKSADIFVKNLINLGGVILFSAAVPGQGGQNHINEQWLTYWEEKFAAHDYELKDVLRPKFWNNKRVFWWYKQNMVLFTPKGYFLKNSTFQELPKDMRNIVHYECFEEKSSQNMFFNIKSGFKNFIKNTTVSMFGQNNFQKINPFGKKQTK